MPRPKKANKIPREWVYCPVCELPYGFVRCRVSYWENGVRKEICLTCGAARERAKEIGLSSNGRTGDFGSSNLGSSPSDPANGKIDT